jgi:hypothetical protein
LLVFVVVSITVLKEFGSVTAQADWLRASDLLKAALLNPV